MQEQLEVVERQVVQEEVEPQAEQENAQEPQKAVQRTVVPRNWALQDFFRTATGPLFDSSVGLMRSS